MRQRIPGIKRKIFGYLLGFCFLLILILALFQTVFLNRFYIAIKTRQVEQVIKTTSTAVMNEDWDSISAQSDTSDIFIEVWDQFGALKASSGSPIGDIHPALPREGVVAFFRSLSEEGPVTNRQQKPDIGMRMRESIVNTQVVTSSQGNEYAILVSAMLSPVNATVETLRVQLVWISVLMLLLSILIALLISRKISKPIESISRTAGELGKGQYNIVFHGNGYREVKQLAQALTDAAAELSKTEELRRELIANVSHDLRTPLTLIAGYSEMIRDIPQEATPENLQVIIDETNRLTALVNDLLDLSKIQAGIEEMASTPFDLVQLAREIVERMTRFYGQEGFTFVLDVPGEALCMRGDRQRIAQIIYNVMLNAVNHTGKDKKVSLRLFTVADNIRLEITDTGKGIAPEDQPYIWERYYQVDVHRGRPKTGTGLGLSIVRSILDRHPGIAYGVESVLAQGTTFWFEMPLCADALPESADT